MPQLLFFSFTFVISTCSGKNTSIFVANLPMNATEELLSEVFKKIGPIKPNSIQIRSFKVCSVLELILSLSEFCMFFGQNTDELNLDLMSSGRQKLLWLCTI